MKKPTKANPKLSNSGRRYGALIESMDKNIKQILEGHDATNVRIDKFYVEFVEFRHETKTFQNETRSFQNEMYTFRDDTKSNFKTLQEHLSLIDDDLKIYAGRLEKLEKRVNGIEIKLAS